MSVSEIGDAENISKSYVSRILRLALLAPAIVDAILMGTTDQGVMLEQLERPLPASWEEQRRKIFPTSDDYRPSTAELVGSPTPPSSLGVSTWTWGDEALLLGWKTSKLCGAWKARLPTTNASRRPRSSDHKGAHHMITISAFKWVPDFAQGQVRDLRARWALEEAGLPYNARLLEQGDQDKPDYRALQPFGQV
jgi:hypothetical protein